MKAMARRDMGYPEYSYTNWIKGNKYNVRYEEESFVTHVIDEQGIEFHFCGKPEDLTATDSFDFVKE